MSIRTAINALLTLQTVLAILSLLICIAFVGDYPVLAWFDGWVHEVRLHRHQRQYDLIVEEYREGTDKRAVVTKLDTLLTALDDVQKTDTAQGTKRAAFAQIVWVSEEIQDFPGALAWVDRWIEFDPLDLNAQAERASLLMLTPSTQREGIEAFDRLVERFPESLVLAEIRATAYGRVGQLKEAFRSFARFIPQPRILQAGAEASPLVPSIGSPFTNPLQTFFTSEGKPVEQFFYWSLANNRLRLNVDSDNAYDQISIHLPQDDALDFHVVTPVGLPVKATGLTEVGPGKYRKPERAPGKITIVGHQEELEVEVGFAPPRTLLTLISPQVLPVLTTQLSDDPDLLKLLDIARGMYAPEV